MWTRAQMLRDLVSYFTSIGITGQSILRQWAAEASFDDDFKGRVSGLGAAVFQWLVMRQGVDTVKPDVHVHRFAARVLGRPLSDTDVVRVIVAAAQRLGRPAHRLDWAIWEAGRNTVAARASARRGLPERMAADSVALPAARDEGPVERFVDDDPGYLAWVAAHVGGYVLNSERNPSRRYLVLHRARCHTMVPRATGDTRSWTNAYRRPALSTPASSLHGQKPTAEVRSLPAESVDRNAEEFPQNPVQPTGASPCVNSGAADRR